MDDSVAKNGENISIKLYVEYVGKRIIITVNPRFIRADCLDLFHTREKKEWLTYNL